MRLALPALAVLATVAPAAAQAKRIQERCAAALDRLHDAGDFPGGSAALVLPDGSTVTFTTGFASVEDERKMKPSDRMLSGSIGKTYVAAAALELAQRGKIGLDDKIADYLGKEPWFDRLPNAAEIRILDLLRHTSGIPRYVMKRAFWRDLLAHPTKVWKPAECVGYVLGDGLVP